MSLPVVISLCLILLTATHVLDGFLKRCRIKKSLFLIYIIVCFAIFLTPAYNINRYLSVHLFFGLAVISYIVLIGRRRKTLMAVKEITFIFFTTLIFILQMICELLLDGYAWYVYVKLSAVVLYAAFYIDKPADGGICAFFGIWLLQLLLVIRNMIIDSYIYFDLGNPETIKISLLCALGAIFLSYIKRVVREPKKKKEISPNMELFTSSDKK